MKKRTILKTLIFSSMFALSLSGCVNNTPTTPDYSNDKRYQIYQLAVADGYTGTYEQWLESIRGKDGQDGHTPEIKIGDNGHWFIDGVDTGVNVKGEDGKDGKNGQDGAPGKDGEDGKDGLDGQNGQDGKDGEDGQDGKDGEKGEDGTSLLTGNGNPLSTLGKNGDSYIDLLTWNYYVKENDQWAPKGNIKGATGEEGQPGSTGQTGEQGISVADVYFDFNGDLIVVLSNGHTINAGHVKDNTTYWNVSFDTNGANSPTPDTQLVVNGGKAREPARPLRSGYAFKGWTFCDELWSFNGYVVTCDMILTAKWEKIEYNINYLDDDGTLLYHTTLDHTDYGSTYPYENPKKEDDDIYQYQFSGWEYSLIGYEQTITATYRMCSTGLEFINYNGSIGSYGYSVYRYTNTVNKEVFVPKTWSGTQVEAICPNAFANHTEIETIHLPDGLEYICDHAFSGCTNLKNLVIPSSVKRIEREAFAHCDSLESIELQGELEFIDYSAFDNFNGVKRTIYGNATYLGTQNYPYLILESAVDKDITSCEIHEQCLAIKDGAFKGCIALTSLTLSNNIKSVGDGLFEGCISLTSVNIPSSISSTGHSVSINLDIFKDCTSLENIDVGEDNRNYSSKDGVLFNKDQTELLLYPKGKTGAYVVPNTVTNIKEDAFENCKSLTSITLPDSLTKIEQFAFSGSSIESITIPASVSMIGFCAFSGCKELTNITINEGVTYIDSYAFNYCTALESVVIPNSVTDLKSMAFRDCKSLKSVVIGSGVTQIEEYTFMDCYQLNHVELPDSLETIKLYGFANCISLYSITIPSGVTLIQPGAFKNCSNLVEIINESALNIQVGESTYGEIGLYAKDVLTDATLSKVSIQNNFVIYDNTRLVSYIGDDKIVNIPTGIETVALYSFVDRHNIEEVNFPEGITTIEQIAFLECENIKTINLPSTLESCTKAFVACDGLENIIVSNSNNNFTTEDGILYNKEKTSLYVCPPRKTGNVVVPNGVTRLEQYAFLNCAGLTSITLPNSLTFIHDSSFEGCSSIEEIVIPASVDTIGGYAFKDCTSLKTVNIPDGVNQIYSYAFENCSSLEQITIPDSVTTISAYAFENCSALKSIVIPKDVDEIAGYVFNGCSSLTSVTIPEGVDEIGSYAFKDCTSLKDINLPNSVGSIRMFAFEGCSSLESITLSTNLSIIRDYAFKDCTSLASIAIPNGVTTLQIGLFENCASLTNVVIPNSVTSIMDSAFENCSSLKSITLPNNLTTIGQCAFYGCGLLKTVNLPDTVTSIGYGAFGDCDKLEYIIFPEGMESISPIMFENCSNLRWIVLPSTLTSIYYSTFNGCDDVRYIFYSGTREEYENIEIKKYSSNDVITWSEDVIYYYSETIPTDEGNYWHFINGVPVIW